MLIYNKSNGKLCGSIELRHFIVKRLFKGPNFNGFYYNLTICPSSKSSGKKLGQIPSPLPVPIYHLQ
jgi:hypothetical protein